MKPYYDDGKGIIIYHGDCREILPSLPKADLVLTDPPYGVNYKAMRGGRKAIAGDDTLEAAVRLLDEALSLAARAPAYFVCCDWRNLELVRRSLQRIGMQSKACIVWDKLRGVQNLDRYHKQHEFLLYAGPFGGEPTRCGDVWRFDRDFSPEHPTPKPVGLMLRAIETSTARGALVLDPFLGAGATTRAAKDSGRKAIGIEIEERYCEVAANRLGQEVFDFGGAQ